jgi:hypothetical protein
MMIAQEVVARGEGWSLVKNPDGIGLVLCIDKQPFVVRPHQVEVVLPPDFVTELFQQKRAVRRADEDCG